jgi:hypothetical protein
VSILQGENPGHLELISARLLLIPLQKPSYSVLNALQGVENARGLGDNALIETRQEEPLRRILEERR